MKEIFDLVKKYKWLCILIFFIIPIIIYLLSVTMLLPSGGNDWAGFWGGYLGAIIGALVAIYVMRKTLENERDQRREERKEKLLTEICELVAEYCALTNESNSHLLRFHQTGESEWNYEALYKKCEATKLENILQIKLLSREAHSYNLRKELLDSILKVGEITDQLHDVTVSTFEELAKEANQVSEELANLMKAVYTFISENEE